ncbi:MAG: hypothetical protein EOP11_20570 [Proteobacteria bacterium]|nr:MAG: hypothetical protein EOP11_20570 [Pseudomonadota bacterium]
MITLFALLLSPTLPANAADTSGCSQLVQTTAHATTANGNLLTATYAHAARANCWNASQAAVTIAYRFSSETAQPSVGLWVKLNGRDQTLTAQVTCSSVQSGIAKDTSPRASFACFALATLPTATGAQELEIAPSVNGAFDTSAYGQNSRLSL